MNPLAFWRLLGRPVVLVAIVWTWPVLIWVSLMFHNALTPGSDGAFFAKALGRAAFLFCTVMGAIAGQAMREVQHSLVSFPLPGLRREFRIGAALLGLSAALLAGAAYSLSGGPLPIFWLSMIGLLGYSLALFDTFDSASLTALRIAALAFLAVRLEQAIGLSAQNPPAALSICLAVMAWCGWRSLGIETFRLRPFIPSRASISVFSLPVDERYKQEKLRHSDPLRKDWRARLVGDSKWRWARAVIRGSSGDSRWGWGSKSVNYTVFFALSFLALSLWLGYMESGTLAQGLELGYASLAFASSDGQLLEGFHFHVTRLTLFITVLWYSIFLVYPIRIPTEKVYPLSRLNLGQTAARVGMLHLAALTAYALLAFGLQFILLAGLTGNPLRLGHLPVVLVVILANAALVPALQIRRLTARIPKGGRQPYPRQFIGSILLYLAAVCGFVNLWTWLISPFGAMIELAAFALLVVSSQRLYRWLVMRYFLRADLA